MHFGSMTMCWLIFDPATGGQSIYMPPIISQKEIVLYWFKQRDRILTNEYLVKVYLFWDAVSRGRTDGALVRIASLVGPGETEEIVDQRLLRFVSTIEPELTRYVPD